MKRVLVALLAISATALMAPAAAEAQRWPSIRSRAPDFEARVEDGERSGALNRDDAERLRAAMDALLAREQDYRYSRPGMTISELEDLDERFDDLSQRLGQALAQGPRGRFDRYDTRPSEPEFQPAPEPGPEPPQAAPPEPVNPSADEANAAIDDGWPSMNERRQGFLDRVQTAETSGELTRSEAAGLRGDFDGLVRREDFYRQDGAIDSAERRDLDMAFADLQRRLHGQAEPPAKQAQAAPPASPPAAAPAPPADEKTRWRDIRNIQADLDERIDEARENGVVSDGEAKQLHQQASDLVGVEDDYRASAPGLTHEEIADLEAKIAAIEDRVGRPPPADAKQAKPDEPERRQRAVNDFTPL
jgi:hypothetical protein